MKRTYGYLLSNVRIVYVVKALLYIFMLFVNFIPRKSWKKLQKDYKL
jgi:hypothetical protein